GNITDVRDPQLVAGYAVKHVVVRPDTLDGPEGSWSETGARTVGRAQIHGYAQQRHLQITKIGGGKIELPAWRIEQGRNAGIRGRHHFAVQNLGSQPAKKRIRAHR